MKLLSVPFLALGLAQTAQAHFAWSHLLVNGTESALWQYIRNVSPNQAVAVDFGKADPQVGPDISGIGFRCGRNGSAPSPKTQTATVVAGSSVGFRLGRMSTNPIIGDGTSVVIHPGPGQVYLAKAPSTVTDLSSWDGAGDWFKIAYAGPASDTTWKLYRKKDMNFTIPQTTPPGKYLMRMEFIYPMDNIAQYYANCAQIEIVGPGGGSPNPTVKFPGAYGMNSPGIYDGGMFGADMDNHLLKYPMPGPAVWTG